MRVRYPYFQPTWLECTKPVNLNLLYISQPSHYFYVPMQLYLLSFHKIEGTIVFCWAKSILEQCTQVPESTTKIGYLQSLDHDLHLPMWKQHSILEHQLFINYLFNTMQAFPQRIYFYSSIPLPPQNQMCICQSLKYSPLIFKPELWSQISDAFVWSWNV